MMDAAEVTRLKALMEWEGRRTAPPEGFPTLPDMPAARYTSPEYFALEREHVFRKSWLFAGHMDGRIRAYDSASGKVIWEFDASEPVDTLSGGKATGGSVGGGGPVVYDGMVYVNSGYGLYFHMPGNLLLAFGVKE